VDIILLKYCVGIIICFDIDIFQPVSKTDSSLDTTAWDVADDQMFLVCVYNVSKDQPYTIFKAPVSSTAQDIITQVWFLGSIAKNGDSVVLYLSKSNQGFEFSMKCTRKIHSDISLMK
jgi:hypothetical protein